MSLFITASEPDAKSINRLLLYLRDWEYGEEGTWDSFQLIVTETLPSARKTTVPPVIEFSENAWAGKGLHEVEQFALKHADVGVNVTNAVIVDDQGIQDQTCIILEREYDFDASDNVEALDKFKKTRLPWDEVHIMWANLSISNMGLEEYCDDGKGDQGDGWYVYEGIHGHDEHSRASIKEARDKVAKQRDHALSELVKLGYA